MNKDILRIDATPASLKINFEEAKAQIEAEVDQYDVVVTEDSVGDAKKLATMLNKRAKEIDQRRKDAIAEVSAPIKSADEQFKQLVAICKNGRQRIMVQVEKFEDVQRERAAGLLKTYREEYWIKFGVKDEFKSAEFDDLVKLTALTGKGNLTAATDAEIRQRVQADKSMQDQTERRLLELENRSYRADLAAPLTRDHVRPFLFADDETYERELTRIIDAELQREKVAAERERQRQARAVEPPKEQTPAEAPQTRAEPEPAPDTDHQAQAEPAAPDAPDQAGTIRWRVTVTFSVETSDSVGAEKVCEAAYKRMLDANIKTMTDVRAIGSNEDTAVLRPGLRR